MKQITIALNDDLVEGLNAEALRRGTTLVGVINDLLRQALAQPGRPGRYILQLTGWEAQLRPSVDILDRDKLFDAMNHM